MLAALLFPSLVAAQTMDSMPRAQALEPSDFPRKLVLIGTAPDSLGAENWEVAARRAAEEWNSVVCSTAVLDFVGNVPSSARPANSTAIAFVDPDQEPCFVNPGDLGWTLLSPCGDWLPTDVLLNATSFTWGAAPAPYQTDTVEVDAASVITHELGHSLGLHHADVESSLATMAPRYLRDGGLATLSAEDKLALCALYPVSRSECATADDCAGDCVAGDEGAVCDEYRAPVGAYCDLAELECATCLVTSPETFSGYCSLGCEDDAACGGDLICEDGFCRYPFVPAKPGGCSVGATQTFSALWLLLPVWIRRRYSAVTVASKVSKT